jgi:hypothetical protein
MIMKSGTKKLAGLVERMEGKRNEYKVLVGELIESAGGTRKQDRSGAFKDTARSVTDWISLAQGREKWQAVVIAVLTLRVPQYNWHISIIETSIDF